LFSGDVGPQDVELTRKVKNLPVPLSDQLYALLQAQASRTARPAAQLAREAIVDWLRSVKREEVSRQLARYAAACAGTDQDLDPDLEDVAIDELRRLDQQER